MAQWLDLPIHLVNTHILFPKEDLGVIEAFAFLRRETRVHPSVGKFYRSSSLSYVRAHHVSRSRLFAVRCASFFLFARQTRRNHFTWIPVNGWDMLLRQFLMRQYDDIISLLRASYKPMIAGPLQLTVGTSRIVKMRGWKGHWGHWGH